MRKKVIVVGAGPGGLAIALRLLGQGHQVEIFEAADRAGGRMRGLVQGHYHFDTGPTILQMPQLYDDLFASAGLQRQDYLQFTRLDPYTRLKFWDGTQLDLTTDRKQLKQQLAQFRPDLPQALDRWLTEAERMNQAGYEPYLSQPARSLLGYARLDELAAVLSFRPWETLYQHFWRNFQDDRLVYALSYPAKYLGMHPTRSASVFSLIPYLEMVHGVWHPQGGFRALAQALAQAIQELGGKIHLRCPVQELTIQQGRATGIRLGSGERLCADAVVVNGDFAQAMQSLIPPAHRGKYTRAYFANRQFSCSTFMLYLGLDRCYDLPHHQIYLSEHVRRRHRPYVDDSALDPIDPPFYVCNPTPTDGSNAPPGHSTLYVLVPIPHTGYGVNWPDHQQSYRDFILDRLPELGFLNLADHITTEACHTAQTWQEDYSVYLGAVFNLSHTWLQMGPFRPPIRSRQLDRLYWVGGAVHPGSGLMTILESSKNAAKFVSQDLRGAA
ncbi:phytoene desaturase family protein [Lyngbya confervoides]|uniref:Phytoene desaturase family protein n=1 Tax=Lyngbya confervoides BDU141951 TaxID=1574623 RepID=A0ABD4T6X0_9CYAN|nr:phytoene desaturase family protein [Lyngbya confervoides]MCM1984225.1 phytoene desaturase family protein [Lyngbya confervoides BDU141951]